jgi:hypothetical protein
MGDLGAGQKHMITVHIPNDFIPERTYAIRTLLTHYCGIQVQIVTDHGLDAYVLKWDDKSIRLADHFFGKIPEGKPYIDSKHLPSGMVETTSPGLEGIIMMYGKEHLEVSPENIRCDIDLFAGVFFMLTRWEEALDVKRDQHNRFPASEAALVKNGFILRPVIDEYAALIKKWLQGFRFPVPAETGRAKLVPTCDVDIPYYWQSKPAWKSLGGRLLKHWNILESVKEYAQFKAVQSKGEKDPYDTFDYLMSLAEKQGVRFQFNFLGGGSARVDAYYRCDDPPILALMEEIKSRGHIIGVHPSYDAYNDSTKIKSEKENVEAAAGHIISKSRQHYLRFSVPETWRYLEENGIAEDSTLGYAAEPGFRCGTCKPFPVFDILHREQLNLIERPLLIMDVSFRMYKHLSIPESIALSNQIKEQVKKHHGEFVILWHNSNLSEIEGWDGWEEVLESLMSLTE